VTVRIITYSIITTMYNKAVYSGKMI